MKKAKLNIIDERMLELSEILLKRGMIKFKQEMWDAIKTQKQTINNIRIGKQHFTVRQIQAACKKFSADANWIIGIQNKRPFQKPVKKMSVLKTDD